MPQFTIGESIILAVTGGRKWNDYGFVRRNLDSLHSRYPISLLIHGAAKGWDEKCDIWAKANGVEVKPIPAKWSDLSWPDARIRKLADGTEYDARAGMRRNGWILDLGPDILLAGPGGAGTAGMIRLARARNIPILLARK